MKSKALFFFLFLLFSTTIFAQTTIDASTREFKVTGKVKAEKIISLSELKSYKNIELQDINVSCSPRKEDKAKAVKGVLVKTILDSVAFEYEYSRLLGQYYFLFVANDGYKIVFSFNEVYNTEIGNNLYIVTEIDGKDASETSNKVLLLSTKDIKGGSRNVRWLSKIVVCDGGEGK
jgi:hypothetical protein